MKLLKIILLLTFLLSPFSYSQWWVSGGNLLWPYGDVLISKGNLKIDSILSASGEFTIVGPSGSYIYFEDFSGVSRIKLISKDITDSFSGDIEFWMNPEEGFQVDSPTGFFFNSNSGEGNFQVGSTSIYLNPTQGIIFGGGSKFKFLNLPSDSSGLTTGHIFFDPSTGVIKRKF